MHSCTHLVYVEEPSIPCKVVQTNTKIPNPHVQSILKITSFVKERGTESTWINRNNDFLSNKEYVSQHRF